MIIYNVTVNVEDGIHDAWFQWMKETHIRAVMDTKMFKSYRFSKVLANDDTGTTYSVQYVATDMESFKLYEQLYAQKLRQEALAHFGNKFIAFRTLLEIIDEN